MAALGWSRNREGFWCRPGPQAPSQLPRKSRAGEATLKTYNNARDGTVRAGLDLVAHAVLTEYHVGRKRQAVKAAKTGAEPEPEAPPSEPQSVQAEADFNDDIPF